jgi:hypothetical protein
MILRVKLVRALPGAGFLQLVAMPHTNIIFSCFGGSTLTLVYFASRAITLLAKDGFINTKRAFMIL